jgi:hypothetical protein
MTINDIELEKCQRELCKSYSLIDILTRNGQGNALFNAYANIEAAAREAQRRLNELTEFQK